MDLFLPIDPELYEVENTLTSNAIPFTMDINLPFNEAGNYLTDTSHQGDASPHELAGVCPPGHTDFSTGESNIAVNWNPNFPYGYANVYTQSHTDSSEQYNLWLPRSQAGSNVDVSGFDFSATEMVPRRLTQTPIPLSSADMFDGHEMSTPIESNSDHTKFSPRSSKFSSHSSHSSDTSWPISPSLPQASQAIEPNIMAPAPTPQLVPSTPQRTAQSSSPRPYICTHQGCSRAYARKFELYRHQRRHSGIRPHYCRVPTCDRGAMNGFFRKDHLKQHMRQVHSS